MKNPHLPAPKMKLQGPDGKPLHVSTSQNIQSSSKELKSLTVPTHNSEHIGGRAIAYKKPPRK